MWETQVIYQNDNRARNSMAKQYEMAFVRLIRPVHRMGEQYAKQIPARGIIIFTTHMNQIKSKHSL